MLDKAAFTRTAAAWLESVSGFDSHWSDDGLPVISKTVQTK